MHAPLVLAQDKQPIRSLLFQPPYIDDVLELRFKAYPMQAARSRCGLTCLGLVEVRLLSLWARG